MCKKYPGPRCSYHTKLKLDEAIETAEADPTPENLQAVSDARYAYNTTPDGLNALRNSEKQEDRDSVSMFEAIRKQQLDHLKAVQAKEAHAMRKELEGIYSEHGIHEVRAMGDDDLADRLEERSRRAAANKGNEAGVVHKTNFTKPQDEPTDASEFKKPSLGAVVLAGAVQGGIAGFRNQNGGVVSALKTGINVGKGEAMKAEAQETAHAREKEKVTIAQEREAERADKAFEREQAQLTREQERIEKADLAWHNKLEADCIRYIKAQRREAEKRSKAKHTKPSVPKPKNEPQSQAA
jgi:hypothetical protein